MLVAGCTGDGDGGGGSQDAATPGGSPSEEGRTSCEAEVRLRGDLDAKWKGEGDVSTLNPDSPPVYKTQHKKFTLILVAASGDTPALVSLSTGSGALVAGPDSGTIEVEDDGSGARIDATLEDNASSTQADVVATLIC